MTIKENAYLVLRVNIYVLCASWRNPRPALRSAHALCSGASAGRQAAHNNERKEVTDEDSDETAPLVGSESTSLAFADHSHLSHLRGRRSRTWVQSQAILNQTLKTGLPRHARCHRGHLLCDKLCKANKIVLSVNNRWFAHKMVVTNVLPNLKSHSQCAACLGVSSLHHTAPSNQKPRAARMQRPGSRCH